MRTTTDEWPEDVLGCPLRSGYAGAVAPMFDRTTVGEAPTAFLRTRHDEKRVYSVEFIWTLGQLAAFEDWFINTLNSGMRSFMMRHITSGILEPLMCHFSTVYIVTPQQDHANLFRVGFDLTAFWRVGASPDWS